MPNAISTPAYTVKFAEEKFVEGTPEDLAIGRTDLTFGVSKKTGRAYGPYTVIRHVAKRGNGTVVAMCVSTSRVIADAPVQAAAQKANDTAAQDAGALRAMIAQEIRAALSGLIPGTDVAQATAQATTPAKRGRKPATSAIQNANGTL